ncbi:MAG TPA: B12-binding domain-containing radical SAM protein, partial [Firmicutes bacterium]|nr:B12-binding domain-containing radical SAM protein [Bacillota bacterium]
MNKPDYHLLLDKVQKPARYLGGEINAVYKPPDGLELRLALAFPDLYEVGMSHLGLKILYGLVNNMPGMSAERVFAPGRDMEELLQGEKLPLFSLEGKTPLCDFDLVGFTIQYELSYTAILNMLELGGIPLRSEERKRGDPFIIGGGPCVFNPEPLAPFFD